MPEDALAAITALVDAQFPDGGDDGADSSPSGTTTDVGTEGTGTTEAPTDASSKPPEPDEFDKILDAEGVKNTSERENRIPYKRVKKIIENALKKEKEASGKVVGEHTTKLTAAEQELQRYRDADTAAKTDPDRYMQILSVINPAFAAYQKQQAQQDKAAKEAAKPVFDKPRPAPDTQFQDGTVGYSPEQHEKLLDWVAEKAEFNAEQRAIATMEARYGKTVKQIEDTTKANEAYKQNWAKVQKQQQYYKEIYGDEIVQHQDAIAKELAAYDGGQGRPYMPADLVVAKFMTAKLNEKVTKARETVMSEMNDRGKAATKRAPAQTKAVRDPDEMVDMNEEIDQILREKGL